MGLLFAPLAPAGTWSVRRDAAPGGNGLSWASAFQAVQDGLAAAQAGDEVWVAKATYRPGTAASPRTVSFQLVGGVALYGGFAGTEASLAERDWIANPTVLSGDLLLDDAPGFVNRSDNCYHVVRAQGTGTVLDGFIVTGGNANGSGDDARGGGILGAGGLTLRNMLVEENEASFSGGGLAGGVLVERSTFRANRAGYDGGGIVADSQALQVVACRLIANQALLGAGLAVSFTLNSDSSMRDCLVVGNVASSGGGGVRLWYSGMSIRGSTIAFNHAPEGGGVTTAGGFGIVYSNSILWGNTGGGSVLQQQISTSIPAFSVATVFQGWTEPWNQDPRWSDPLGPDGVPGTADDDFTLSCLSPYIDRGSNPHAAGSTLDLAGNPRFADDPATPDLGTGSAPIIDLGPYEFVCACDEVESYCTAAPNSIGLSASISASGSTSIFANSLVLHVEDGPPLKNGLFFYGKLQAAAPFGDGILCVGGSLFRLSVVQLDARGAASFALDLARPPAGSGPGQVIEGSVWNFQFYFRDPLGGPSGWNCSDALAVSFCR
jgi:hypothetical protein